MGEVKPGAQDTPDTPCTPHTPQDLISTVNYASPPAIQPMNFRSPLTDEHSNNNNHNNLTDDEDDIKINFNLTTTDSTTELQSKINQILINIESDPNFQLSTSELKSLLKKCQISLNHYKLQTEILKFENNETCKRNEIENDLIKSQVECLLKSPLVPIPLPVSNNSSSSTKSDSTSSSINGLSSGMNSSSSSDEKTFIFKQHSFKNDPKVSKVSKIQRRRNSSKNLGLGINDTKEFNHCVKVFHLERK